MTPIRSLGQKVSLSRLVSTSMAITVGKLKATVVKVSKNWFGKGSGSKEYHSYDYTLQDVFSLEQQRYISLFEPFGANISTLKNTLETLISPLTMNNFDATLATQKIRGFERGGSIVDIVEEFADLIGMFAYIKRDKSKDANDIEFLTVSKLKGEKNTSEIANDAEVLEYTETSETKKVFGVQVIGTLNDAIKPITTTITSFLSQDYDLELVEFENDGMGYATYIIRGKITILDADIKTLTSCTLKMANDKNYSYETYRINAIPCEVNKPPAPTNPNASDDEIERYLYDAPMAWYENTVISFQEWLSGRNLIWVQKSEENNKELIITLKVKLKGNNNMKVSEADKLLSAERILQRVFKEEYAFEITGNFLHFGTPLISPETAGQAFLVDQNYEAKAGIAPFAIVRNDNCPTLALATELAEKHLLINGSTESLRVVKSGLYLAGEQLYGGYIASSEVDIDVYHGDIYSTLEVNYGN
jgi:hypothetical protein